MWVFGRKSAYCAICNKKLTHRHKPKREWNIKGSLCGDCHFEKSKEFYEGKVRQPCAACGVTWRITDLWEPRWQWDMEGLLCKKCFDGKEKKHEEVKNFCAVCGTKMGLVRYNPKDKWNIDGQLCRKCWDQKKLEMK